MEQKNWDEFHRKMTGLSRWVLGHIRRGTGNHQDAVQSAFSTFFRRERLAGRLPEEEDPDDIWPVLMFHLARKMDSYRHQQSYLKNRGIRLGDLVTEEQEAAWKESFVEYDLTLEDVEDYVNAALGIMDDLIEDEELRQIAALKLQAYEHKEIAAQIPNLSVDSVTRRLATIRRKMNAVMEEVQE